MVFLLFVLMVVLGVIALCVLFGVVGYQMGHDKGLQEGAPASPAVPYAPASVRGPETFSAVPVPPADAAAQYHSYPQGYVPPAGAVAAPRNYPSSSSFLS